MVTPFRSQLRRALLGLVLAPAIAHAQDIAPFRRPGDERIPLPEVEGALEEPEFELPPAPEPQPGRLSDAPRIVVQRFEVTGATVLSPEEIAKITKAYENRALTGEDLQRLRDELTLAYVDAGYVNSGASIPEQQIENGVARIEIVEGTLSRIAVAPTRWFRENYFRERLERVATQPLQVRPIEQRLQLFQQDPRIRRVQAQLEPGDRPGEAVLEATFEEEPPYRFWVGADNYESPSIGSYVFRTGFGHDNLLGYGDRIWAEVGRSRGYEDYGAGYEIPVNTYDTTVGLTYSYSRSNVVEMLRLDPGIQQPDISSRSQTAAFNVRHPLLRDRSTTLDLTGSLEWRESRNFFLGEPTSFGEGPKRGVSRVTVLRTGLDWVYRDLAQVVAVRSNFSTGLELLNATVNTGSKPDGQFLTWLGQFQWLRRFDQLGGIQTLFRTDVQLATSALLSLEQFAVGGHATVRGYRENQLVRDNGWVSSLELRLPLLSDGTGRPILQLAPFADIGSSWNTDRDESHPRTLASVGVGLRWQITDHAEGQVYWGEALRDVSNPDDHDLQDDGVQFRVALSY